jgi:hypothetical protein
MKIITTEMYDKNVRALDVRYGEFTEPWFDGDITGWVWEVFSDHKHGGVHLLIFPTPGTIWESDIWLMIPYAEMKKLGISRPEQHSIMSFTVRQKLHHPRNTRCYQIEKAWVIEPWNVDEDECPQE